MALRFDERLNELKTFIANGEPDAFLHPEAEHLAPLTRRLIKYMLGRDKATVADLKEHVWGKGVTDSALHTALHRANVFFLTAGLPRQLSKVSGEAVVKWQ